MMTDASQHTQAIVFDRSICYGPVAYGSALSISAAVTSTNKKLIVVTTYDRVSVLGTDGRAVWTRTAPVAGHGELLVQGPPLISAAGDFMIQVMPGRRTTVFDGVPLDKGGSLIIYDSETGRVSGSLPFAYPRAFSPDGSRLFVLDDGLHLKMISADQWKTGELHGRR
jgi:hypothetical protein